MFRFQQSLYQVNENILKLQGLQCYDMKRHHSRFSRFLMLLKVFYIIFILMFISIQATIEQLK